MDIRLIDSREAGLLPYGLSAQGACFYICLPCPCRQLELLLSRAGQLVFTATFPEKARQGEVWRIGFTGISRREAEQMTYCFRADDQAFADPYGRAFQRDSAFGQGGPEVLQARLSAAFPMADSSPSKIDPDCRTMSKTDSETAKAAPQPLAPPLSFAESVLYRLHVRGFTIDQSSGLSKELRGTFDGLREKLSYLQELGITSLELLPCYEYEERIFDRAEPCFGMASPAHEAQSTVSRVNYWGFTGNALRFAPKAAFGGAAGFLRLVEAVHDRGMELMLDFYFDGTEPPDYAAGVLRHWRQTYGIDGAHLIGVVDAGRLLSDPYLRGMKLMADTFSDADIERAQTGCWPLDRETGGLASRHSAAEYAAAAYNEGFARDLRRYLKGDAGQIAPMLRRFGEASERRACVHYLANVDGFSLMDLFSYNEKHNEANGEGNRDGVDCNDSWNCGEEGPSRRKAVRKLRRQLYQNGLLLTFLSRGTPLLNAGDEMGHSRKGNNNAWCQDNRTEWIDWRDLRKNRELYDFVRHLIRFRRDHAVLFGGKQGQGYSAEQHRIAGSMETASTPAARQFSGLPPLSFHGQELWRVDESPNSRQLGLLYCGADGEAVYLCSNMHWEAHMFSLPPLPPGLCWQRLLDTAKAGAVFAEEGTAVVPKEAEVQEKQQPGRQQDRIMLQARSIQLFQTAPVTRRTPESRAEQQEVSDSAEQQKAESGIKQTAAEDSTGQKIPESSA